MVAAAAEIVASDGIAACTVDEVARRSGVAKTTIYRHFGGVDGLLLAVMDANVRRVPVVDTGSLRDDLAAITKFYLAAIELPSARRLFTWMLSRSADDPDFAVRFRDVRVQPGGPTFVALQRARDRGELDPAVSLDLAMHLVQGPFMSKRVIDNSKLTKDEVESLLDAIVRSLQPG
jgi:AcrR family transcriptional regulator